MTNHLEEFEEEEESKWWDAGFCIYLVIWMYCMYKILSPYINYIFEAVKSILKYS